MSAREVMIVVLRVDGEGELMVRRRSLEVSKDLGLRAVCAAGHVQACKLLLKGEGLRVICERLTQTVYRVVWPSDHTLLLSVRARPPHAPLLSSGVAVHNLMLVLLLAATHAFPALPSSPVRSSSVAFQPNYEWQTVGEEQTVPAAPCEHGTL